MQKTSATRYTNPLPRHCHSTSPHVEDGHERKCAWQVWVLTGDKIETAISIALSCQLFSPTTKLLMLRERDLGSTDSQQTSEVLQLKAVEVKRLLASASHHSSRSALATT